MILDDEAGAAGRAALGARRGFLTFSDFLGPFGTGRETGAFGTGGGAGAFGREALGA